MYERFVHGPISRNNIWWEFSDFILWISFRIFPSFNFTFGKDIDEFLHVVFPTVCHNLNVLEKKAVKHLFKDY